MLAFPSAGQNAAAPKKRDITPKDAKLKSIRYRERSMASSARSGRRDELRRGCLPKRPLALPSQRCGVQRVQRTTRRDFLCL